MKLLRVTGVILVVIGLLYFVNKIREAPKSEESITTPSPTQTLLVTQTSTPTIETIVYEGNSPKGYENLVEELPKIDGEQGYVAFPKSIQKNNPPDIVIYYHGSGQKITKAFTDDVMKNMRKYGSYFTQRNMAFLASNQHGDNQGKVIAITDSDKLIDWVKKKYSTSTRIFVIGFSMGGKPAMRHVLVHPSVARIALLAPAQQIETYTPTEIRYFKNAELKIWHGTADVNVPFWVSEELATYFKKYSVPLQLVTLKGKIHWDVDTEYIPDIYNWFAEEKVSE